VCLARGGILKVPKSRSFGSFQVVKGPKMRFVVTISDESDRRRVYACFIVYAKATNFA